MAKKFRLLLIDAQFGKNNIYRFEARKTISLGLVKVGTVAKQFLPWLEVDIVSENNFRKKLGVPLGENGMIDWVELQKSLQADAVGISASMTNAVPRAKELIRIFKSMPEELRPKSVGVGGWHAGDSPAEMLEAGADFVVHGEGELVICDILKAIYCNNSFEHLKGVSYREKDENYFSPDFLRVPQELMWSYPDPDFGLVRFAKIDLFPVESSRGCAGACTFCRVRGECRYISPDKFMENIARLVSLGAWNFFIVNDRFEENKENSKEILRRLIQFQKSRNLKLKFTVQCRLSLAEDLEFLALMKEANVKVVCIGFESPIKEELLAMRKPITHNWDKIVHLTRTFQKNGMAVHAMMIFGFPIPSPSNFYMSVKERVKVYWKFIRKLKPNFLQILLYTPIIGTEDWDRLAAEDRICTKLGWDLFDGTHLVFKPDAGIDPEELQQGAMKLMRKFYTSPIIWKFPRLSYVPNGINVAITWTLMAVSTVLFWFSNRPIFSFFGILFQKKLKLIRESCYTKYQNSKIYFLAQIIINDWLKKFRESNFMKKLADLR